MYSLVNAQIRNMKLLKDIKLEIITSSGESPNDLELDQLRKYVDVSVREFLSLYKIIIINDSIAGIFMVRDFEDGVLINEIYLYDEYRNKGIGTDLINSIDSKNIYLWVYRNNTRAVKLYKRLGFTAVDETTTRIKMEKRI